MKTIMIAMVCSLGLLTGCDKSLSEISKENEECSSMNGWQIQGLYSYTKVAEIDGHKYVLLHSYNGGGLVHAESCSCRKGDSK